MKEIARYAKATHQARLARDAMTRAEAMVSTKGKGRSEVL